MSRASDDADKTPHDDNAHNAKRPPAARLGDAFALLRDQGEIEKFLYDLCTPRELHDLAERLVIAQLLDQGGLSYREISARTGASTTTVGRVARFLQHEPHQGYRLVLDRIGKHSGSALDDRDRTPEGHTDGKPAAD